MNINYLNDLFSLNNITVNYIVVKDDYIYDLINHRVIFEKQTASLNNSPFLSEMNSILRKLVFKISTSIKYYNDLFEYEEIQEFKRCVENIHRYHNDIFERYLKPLVKIFMSYIFEKQRNPIVSQLKNHFSHVSGDVAIITNNHLNDENKAFINRLTKNKFSISYFNKNSFRKEGRIFDRCIYIGTPYLFGEYSVSVFKSKVIDYIYYDIYYPNQIRKRNLQINSLCRVEFKLNKEKEIKSKARNSNLENMSKEIFQEELKKYREPSKNKDSIKAKILMLENNRFLFIPIGTKIRLFDLENSESNVLEKNSNDVIEGDYIVVNNERESKIIRKKANENLGENYDYIRSLQSEWKERLRNKIRKEGLTSLVEKINQHIEKKNVNEAKLKSWCKKNGIINEHLYEILLILEYSKEEAKMIVEYMKKIRGAHIKAGKDITKILANEISEHLYNELFKEGYYTFESKKIKGASFNIERVIHIDNREIKIKPHNLMKIMKY